jgi:hypothetical protein
MANFRFQSFNGAATQLGVFLRPKHIVMGLGDCVLEGDTMITSKQVAALPVRRVKSGAFEILFVTSRNTGRWIVPNGWPSKRLKDHKAAAREAKGLGTLSQASLSKGQARRLALLEP